MSVATELKLRARRGKTFDLTFTKYEDRDLEIPSNLTGWYVHFQVRKAFGADDPADPYIDWESDPFDGVVGPTGVVSIHVAAVDMEIPSGSYQYEVEMVFDPGNGGEVLKYPLLAGEFEILGEVLR